jgi:hypothetical protein
MHITIADRAPRNVHSLHTNITGDLCVHSYVHSRVPRRKRAAKEQGLVAMTPDGMVRLVLLPQLAFSKGEKPGESCESATEDRVHHHTTVVLLSLPLVIIAIYIVHGATFHWPPPSSA